MKRKSTKVALLTSVICVVLCGALILGGTFAWFSDTVTTGNNKIVAGNLDVELEYLANGTWTKVTETTQVFEENALWEPGHTEVVYLRVSNAGTLALDYKLGVNIAHETPSVNGADQEFKLSDFIQVGVVEDVTTAYATRQEARNAISSTKALNAGYAKEGTLTAGAAAKYVALVVYMPEEVGNEANYKTGAAIPEILLGINLYATQETFEEDSFNNEYDEDATLPIVYTGSAPVVENAAFVYVEARNKEDGSAPKVASITVPNAALADTAENVTITVEKTNLNQNIVVEADEKAVTYEVTVTGVKDGNTTPISVEITVGTGLSGVKLYHYGTEITNDPDANVSYDENTGILSFKTTSFSPFSVVYDAVYVQPSDPTDTEMPAATVNVLTGDALEEQDWLDASGMVGGSAVAEGQTLACAFEFIAPHDATNIEDCAYKDWACDFYVSITLADGTVTELPADMIFLGGNYGDFGWVGFNNPAVPVGTDIPMLQSVAGAWTYEGIARNVGKFICGVNRSDVADVEASKLLNGATFTVKLCLVDPETEEIVPVTLNIVENGATTTAKQIDYVFPDVVTSGDELQDAINNGSGNIELGGDIDLNNGGIVIP